MTSNNYAVSVPSLLFIETMKWKLQTYPGTLTAKKSDGKLSPPPTGGLRSISQRPLVTQHNKSGLSLSSRLVIALTKDVLNELNEKIKYYYSVHVLL